MAYVIAFLIIGAAAWILFRRIRDFKKSGGSSACRNCPYSKTCSGSCGRNGK